MGQEAVRVYRWYRELAIRLSQAGVHVFRFDFAGCGDSWGEADDCSIATWLEDIKAASAEALDTAAARHLSVIGIRMGASLAYLAAKSLPSLDRLILIDPVVDGEGYLKALKSAHAIMLEDPDRFPSPRAVSETDGEFLGFDVSDGLFAELAAIDLRAVAPVSEVHLDLMTTGNSAECEEFLTVLQAGAVSCDHVSVPCDTRWEDGTALERTLIAPALIAAVLERMS
jgi:pimeloyl-ACP methyl ester carboxylesterase